MHVTGHCWTLTLRSCVQCLFLTSTAMRAWFVASIFKVNHILCLRLVFLVTCKLSVCHVHKGETCTDESHKC